MSKLVSNVGSSMEHLQNRLSRSVSMDDYKPLQSSILNPHKNVRSSPQVNETQPLLHKTLSTEKLDELNTEDKLNTFEGVFLQVVLSIWGIILFLRLGYILGQVGYLVTIAMFCLGYAITTFTSLSISAISTNGTVRGGGPYYMISRSLGPEFGGSIGLVVYLGICLNGVLNALASVEGLIEFFGLEHGNLYKILPEEDLYLFIYGSFVVVLSILICFLGSKIVAKTTMVFGFILLISTLSILFSFLFKSPFIDPDPNKHLKYTSFDWNTFKGNLYPQLSYNEMGVKETYQSIFGVLFPACIGIMAGASMSGNLKDPSRSIPKGTLWAIFCTFIAYIILTTMFAFTVPRGTLKWDINVMTHIGLFPPLVNIGVLATSISSTFSCFIGASKILQAMARDNLIPGLHRFGYGTLDGDEPLLAFILTYVLAQIFLLVGEINLVAGIVTMFFVLTFGVTNLACFLLKVGGAPNFRPSFQYFKAWTALVGVLLCFGVMFYVDFISALLSTLFASLIFLLVHFTSPPKAWGDVTQSLIYHQVRKYLLRLDLRKQHVKFWRPQILLLINDPKSNFQLINFCNHLKKGSLFVIGHIIKGDLKTHINEFKNQNNLWLKLIDIIKIKAFIQLSINQNEQLGAQSLLLHSGLGGMVPNIIVLGQFNLKDYRKSKNSKLDSDSEMDFDYCYTIKHRINYLPTDNIQSELPISITDYVAIIEDSLLLGKAVGIGFNFKEIPLTPCLPKELQTKQYNQPIKYIDMWPIQMVTTNNGNSMINFDSYTMVLQLGCILNMVKEYKQNFKLRVCCFVEHQYDVDEETNRVQALLNNLRIPAQLNVFWLDQGANLEYDRIFNLSDEVNMPSNINNTNEENNTFVSTSLRINMPIPQHDDYDSNVNSDIDSDSLSNFSIDFNDTPQPFNNNIKYFNELNTKFQYTILNHLIKQHSENTAIVFSTLPAPDFNCSNNNETSLNYCESLELLTDGLPPTFLVHSKTLTVTTNL